MFKYITRIHYFMLIQKHITSSTLLNHFKTQKKLKQEYILFVNKREK